jgi:uncharacterized membrane protein
MLTEPSHSQFSDLHRLVFLIDGVFAVSITLLVLDLKLPAEYESLAAALRGMLPGFLVYLIVFASIAGYWSIHHGSFHRIAFGDGWLVVLSMFNLLFVTLFPVAASVVGTDPLNPLATVCLSANCLMYCLSAWATWHYAANNRNLVPDENNALRLNYVARIMLFGAAGLVLAIPLAYVNVYLVYAIWIFYVPLVSTWFRLRDRYQVKITPKSY